MLDINLTRTLIIERFYSGINMGIADEVATNIKNLSNGDDARNTHLHNLEDIVKDLDTMLLDEDELADELPEMLYKTT